jgi:hypothetical protein
MRPELDEIRLHYAGVQALSSITEKQGLIREGIRAECQVARDGLPHYLQDWHQPLLSAFPVDQEGARILRQWRVPHIQRKRLIYP